MAEYYAIELFDGQLEGGQVTYNPNCASVAATESEVAQFGGWDFLPKE